MKPSSLDYHSRRDWILAIRLYPDVLEKFLSSLGKGDIYLCTVGSPFDIGQYVCREYSEIPITDVDDMVEYLLLTPLDLYNAADESPYQRSMTLLLNDPILGVDIRSIHSKRTRSHIFDHKHDISFLF
jgi:hypothetical protein